jgi:acetyltransferase EpsM
LNRKITSRQNLIIMGSGSFAQEVAQVAEETGKFNLIGFLDDRPEIENRKQLLGLPVFNLKEASMFDPLPRLICALGTTHRKSFVETMAAKGFPFATIIHPGAEISSKSSIEEGAIINPGSIIASHTHIGYHVIVNRGSLIGHHTTIGNYCTISPGTNIAASVVIGERTYLGIGSIVLDHLSIGHQVVVGAGALVTNNIPDRVQVMGMPAKITKENIEGL